GKSRSWCDEDGVEQISSALNLLLLGGNCSALRPHARHAPQQVITQLHSTARASQRGREQNPMQEHVLICRFNQVLLELSIRIGVGGKRQALGRVLDLKDAKCHPAAKLLPDLAECKRFAQRAQTILVVGETLCVEICAEVRCEKA